MPAAPDPGWARSTVAARASDAETLIMVNLPKFRRENTAGFVKRLGLS